MYNRTQAKTQALLNQGAVRAGTAKEATHGDEFIFSMVSDDSASRGALFTQKLGLNPPLGDVAVGVFQKVIDRGYGDCSESKLIDVLRD